MSAGVSDKIIVWLSVFVGAAVWVGQAVWGAAAFFLLWYSAEI